jgi:PTH1 family peptidyl-tRNA hydrolase
MDLLVGLGNPGKQFEGTRHNIGFAALDMLQKRMRLPAFKLNKRLHAEVTTGKNIVLAKPTTFMNKSGVAVAKIVAWYTLALDQLLVIHDDLDLPFGRIKLTKNASSAGHKGVESIISHLKNKDFFRLRIGIHGTTREAISGEEYVLKRFSREELSEIKKKSSFLEAIELYLQSGPEATMQKFNTTTLKK